MLITSPRSPLHQRLISSGSVQVRYTKRAGAAELPGDEDLGVASAGSPPRCARSVWLVVWLLVTAMPPVR